MRVGNLGAAKFTASMCIKTYNHISQLLAQPLLWWVLYYGGNIKTNTILQNLFLKKRVAGVLLAVHCRLSADLHPTKLLFIDLDLIDSLWLIIATTLLKILLKLYIFPQL